MGVGPSCSPRPPCDRVFRLSLGTGMEVLFPAAHIPSSFYEGVEVSSA